MPVAYLLGVSICDVEDEEDEGQDDAECRQNGHQYQQADGDDARRDLLRDGIRRNLAV